MDGNKHYVRVLNGIIIHKFSDAFESPVEGDLLIYDNAPRHAHLTVPQTITNAQGQFIYKLVNNQLAERTQAELDAEIQAKPHVPTLEDRLKALEDIELERMLGGL